MRRCGAAVLVAACSLLGGEAAWGQGTLPALDLFADTDDDDDDGSADGAGQRLDAAGAKDVRWLTTTERRLVQGARILSPVARWVVDGRGLSAGAALPNGARRVGVQGLAAGKTSVVLVSGAVELTVLEMSAFDAHGARVDLARSHASISRVLPAFLSEDAAGAADQDALRWVVTGPEAALPERLEILSERPDGTPLDRLTNVELWQQPCAPGTAPGLECRTSPLIRATVDPIDRGHPESSGRSIRAEVGGKLLVRAFDRKASSVRVGGPRSTALGAVERFRSTLRVHVLRASPDGPPAIGNSAAEALSLARAEIDAASFIWGQCGIHFGMGKDAFVELVDPPVSHLIAVGCELGLPASGGDVRLRVGKKAIRVTTAFGDTPLSVAERLSRALVAAGFDVALGRNARTESGALPSVDLSVRHGDELVAVERDGDAPLSSDPSLDVCLGSVDLGDGLDHFRDDDAPAGTTEERALIKAYADRDPRTIEVFVVPSFSGQGRVGESFLDAEGSAIRNTVIVDRLAVRAGARSHVLSHELGHVLLDMPGHPDDYGVDQPTALMDADATDPSIFGPRRLSIDECERALRQRGPAARVPLLEPWPLVKAR
jgi:hypothetical protein